ncbi:hypothetical protein Goshw_008904 [Gossypium schwendimanii]|uniref:PPC domain-containing protein n=1 Tax=Gossypium schwendimanii TaxID=34291 RepID=A0A7J9LLN3_GOSSC|nr:hypothetical protein [Gossypium schwendimanii]
MSGTRNVTNITLRQPTSTSAIMSLHGHFEMLSLSGSLLPPPAPPAATGLTIYLVGGQGQIMGGKCYRTLTCLGPIVIMEASYSNVAYERLPLEEEEPSQLSILGDAIESSPGVIEAQHSLEESNVPLFHRLPSNLLNYIQLPSEAFWATGGRPPFLLTISINYHYLENSVQLHLQASTIAKRMINKKLDL